MIKMASTFYLVAISLTLKDTTSIKKVTINLEVVMINLLDNMFQELSTLHNCKCKRPKAIMLE